MDRMIFYKEWLKTRWPLLGMAVVLAAFTAYTMLNLAKVVELRGGAVIWSTLLSRDTVLLESHRYLPAVCGALLALAQFVPEVTRKRLKLTLHLPYPQKKMILMMYGYGIVALVLLFGLQAGAAALIFRGWIARELISRILVTVLVWYLAGLATYIWTTALCLEPTWKMRVVMLIILAALIRLLFLAGEPEAYNSVLVWLFLYVLCGQVLIYYAIARFKEGIQD